MDAPGLAVLGGYLAAMLLIGFATGRRVKTTRAFFTADGRMNAAVVGVSMLATYLSALTMMGLPAMAFGAHDWTYMVQLPFLVLTAAVVARFVVPRYRDAGVVSVYAFLEQRLGAPIRVVGSLSFIVFAVGRMGLVLYLPSLALSAVTQLPLPVCILAMGAVATVYTAAGGMEAVIWTDVAQAVVFVAGAGATLWYALDATGLDGFLNVAGQHNKFRILIPSLDVRRITTLWLILETVFQTVRIYGTQQDMTQRYLAARSTRAATMSLWIGALVYIPLGFLFYFTGTVLFAFYRLHPDPALPARADSVYPYFVATQLPSALGGLVIAAIFAAAMSSIDSAMNSATAVCVEDFVKRFSRASREDAFYLRLARRLTVAWGALTTLMALSFMRIGYAQVFWGKLMGVAANGMLALLVLALLPRPVGWRAALGGFAVGYVCLFVAMRLGVNFLLWPVVGNLACFLAALGFSALAARPAASPPPREA